MNLECRIPQTGDQIATVLERIQDDPMYEHYTPCELAIPLARGLIQSLLLGSGAIVLELTENGYSYLEGARK